MDRQAQTASRMLRGRLFAGDSNRRKEERLLVLRTGIAGKRYRIENEEEQRRLEELQPGTELLLYREPDNEFDPWAIAVYLDENDMIGYVTRFKNEPIARLMDAGRRFIAVVDDPEEARAERLATPQGRYTRGTTEDFSVSFSIYLVENA